MTGVRHALVDATTEGRARAPARRLASVAQRGRELGWLLAGRLAMVVANGVLMLALPIAVMDLATFGLFATAIGAQILLSRTVLLGADQGVVRLWTVPAHGAEAVARTGFGGVVLLSAPLVALAIVAAALDQRSLHPIAEPLVVLSIALGAVGTALFDLGVAEHLATLRHRAAAWQQSAMPIVRLALTLAVAAAAPSDSRLPFLAFAATSFAFGAARLVQVGCRLALPQIRRLLRYSVAIGAADVAMILALQLGLFVLGAVAEPREAGVFAFALTIGQGFFAVYVAFYQTMLPRAARIASLAALPRFLRRAYTMAAALIALGAGAAATIARFVPDAAAALQPNAPELARSGPVLACCAAFALFLILEAPLAVACQYLLRPWLPLAAMTVRFAAIGGAALWLAPERGAFGAAQAQLVGAVCSLVVLAGSTALAIRSAQRRQACAGS